MQAILWLIFVGLCLLQLWGLVRVIYNTCMGSHIMIIDAYTNYGFGGGAKMAITLLIGLFFNRYIFLRLFYLILVLLAWYIVSLFGWTEFIIVRI